MGWMFIDDAGVICTSVGICMISFLASHVSLGIPCVSDVSSADSDLTLISRFNYCQMSDNLFFLNSDFGDNARDFSICPSPVSCEAIGLTIKTEV